MKKLFLLPLTALLVLGSGLTSCGPRKAALTDSYILGEAVAQPTGFVNYSTHQVNFYEGDVYELITTELTVGYSMVLGTTTNITYGTYVAGDSVDGITSYTLNKASEVLFNSYSKMGGYNISINTADEEQTYPVELLASGEGEKVYANSKEEVINAYGLGTTIYCDAKNTFTFINPNEEGDTKDKIETESGKISKVLNKEITNVQVASEVVKGAMDNYKVYQVLVFEDDTYQYIETEMTIGYSMVLGTTTYNTYGEAVYGTSTDGYTPLTLNRATDVVFNSYSKMGGYNLSINTASEDQTYPTELLASGEGEKVYAESKEQVIDNYGKEKTVYSNDAKNDMALTDPNA